MGDEPDRPQDEDVPEPSGKLAEAQARLKRMSPEEIAEMHREARRRLRKEWIKRLERGDV